MKTLYFDCPSGISGDMTLGALIDLGTPSDLLQDAIASLGVSGVSLQHREVTRCGFRAVKVDVVEHHEHHHYQHTHDHSHHNHHHHRSLNDIVAMIAGSCLTQRAKLLATAIFRRLGEAEAKVHGVPIDDVHFHEVGAIDSIADIVGTAVAIDFLEISECVASSVPVGSGTVNIAHGTCVVPVPAVAELLRGIPIRPSNVTGELTTPTGAAIIVTLASRFGELPAMKLTGVGCGAGSRDMPQQPNILRLMLGDTDNAGAKSQEESLWQLECNLDDCSGEQIGYTLERLRAEKVLDVWTTPVTMKKNRPGIIISVLCDESVRLRVEAILFRETTTLGIRRIAVSRTTLARQQEQIATPWGSLDVKLATLPDGSERVTPEYESARQIALQHNLSLQTVYACVGGLSR